jgi:GntR family transcriptional regulator / MocR family aminotransferase
MKNIQLSALSLDPNNSSPLHRQLFLSLRDAILNGTLKAGTRLPATRLLAKDLKVSRNTVLTAFDQLMAEGFLESRVGSGTYISDQLPSDLQGSNGALNQAEPKIRQIKLSNYTQKLYQQSPVKQHRDGAFSPGAPDLEHFPFGEWARLLGKHWRRPSREFLIGNSIGGAKVLREALAQYLGQTRAVRCTADQVIVLSGSQQAIHLVIRAFAEAGDPVLMEDPGYPGIRNSILAAGAEPISVPVDDEGFSLTAAKQLNPDARLACISPSHQYPLGPTMSLSRRLDLLNWAKAEDRFLLEDDYDSEYRYTGRPISSLQGLDTDQRVLYVGTMSKVMFGGLRLGYLVVPPDLVDVFLALRRDVDGHSPATPEAALAEFISEGYLTSHIRRMKLLYERRQECLLALLHQKCQPLLQVERQSSGMHLTAFLDPSIADRKVEELCQKEGLYLRALSRFYAGSNPQNGLIIGFAGTHETQMPAHVDTLARILTQLEST